MSRSFVVSSRAPTHARRLYKQYQRRVAQFWGPGQTTLKGIYLFIVGQRAIVDDLVFGSAAAAKKQK